MVTTKTSEAYFFSAYQDRKKRGFRMHISALGGFLELIYWLTSAASTAYSSYPNYEFIL